MCEAAGVEYMSCSADESRKTCSEFPTAVNGNGNAVCGVSDLPGTGCSAGKTFQEALSLCVGAGARLCTLQEVLDNEVRLRKVQLMSVSFPSMKPACSLALRTSAMRTFHLLMRWEPLHLP